MEPELSTADQARLERLRWLARLLDEALRVPGTPIRVGLDGLIGLVPGVGDALTAFLSLYIVQQATRFGVPRATLARMLANVAIDFLGGTVPLLGDLFDVAWKANRMNVDLLDAHLRSCQPAAKQMAQRGPFFQRPRPRRSEAA